MKGFEIPRAHLGILHQQRFMGVRHIPFRIRIVPLLDQGHRNPVGKRRNLHAGQCRHAIKYLVTDQLCLVVAVAGNIQPHGRSENVVLLKAGVRRGEIPQRSQK